jgi:hypothetical protein
MPPVKATALRPPIAAAYAPIVFYTLIAENIQRQPRRRQTACFQVPHITAGDSGEACRSSLACQLPPNFVRVPAHSLDDEKHSEHVKIPLACSPGAIAARSLNDSSQDARDGRASPWPAPRHTDAKRREIHIAPRRLAPGRRQAIQRRAMKFGLERCHQRRSPAILGRRE